MNKPLFVVGIALVSALTLASCATQESTSSSKSPGSTGTSTSGNVDAGAEGMNQPGRSDPSGASTGQAVESSGNVNQQGRRDKQY